MNLLHFTNNLGNLFYLSFSLLVLQYFLCTNLLILLVRLVRLRIGFSNLREHRIKHNFHDALNTLCSCSFAPETSSRYLLSCHNFSSDRSALMNDLDLIDSSISQLSETACANILLYGDSKMGISKKRQILQSTIKYTFVLKCFDEFLLQPSTSYALFTIYK